MRPLQVRHDASGLPASPSGGIGSPEQRQSTLVWPYSFLTAIHVLKSAATWANQTRFGKRHKVNPALTTALLASISDRVRSHALKV